MAIKNFINLNLKRTEARKIFITYLFVIISFAILQQWKAC